MNDKKKEEMRLGHFGEGKQMFGFDEGRHEKELGLT
jgi:hypothetical protein